MIDFKSITDFFSDKTKSWGFKTATFISIIGFIFLVDVCFSFSYNYHINTKLENLKEIEHLKNAYANDSIKLVKIKELEHDIMYKEHYLNIALKRVRNISETYNTPSKNQEAITQTTEKEIINKTTDIRNIYWMVGSSNLLIVLVFPILLFLPLFGGKESRTGDLIIGVFATLILLGLFAVVTTWIAYKIPIILDKPFLNYILNFLIHSLFWLLVIKNSSDKK
jgi:hypothetical protein